MILPSPLDRVESRLRRAWHARAITLKAASFALVGLVNTGVDFGVFLLARELFRSPSLAVIMGQVAHLCRCGSAYQLAIIPANVVAWGVAVSGSYVLNSLVTFSAESGRQLRLKAYANFVASGIAGLIANTATVYVLSHFTDERIAKICAIAASFAVNFSLSHFVVFRQQSPPVDEHSQT
jgi:putative flippase GtrA